MTVPTTAVLVQFTGDGTTATYPFTFRVTAAADLIVQRQTAAGVAATTLVLGVDYSVAGLGSLTGGTVTLLLGNLANGAILTIDRDPVATQLTSLQAQGTYRAPTIEAMVDLCTMLVQAARNVANRAIQIPLIETLAGSVVTLPPAAVRASQYLGFDSSGNVITLPASTASGTTVIATGSTTARFLADRFVDAGSAKDFGALGNGVADDRVAILAQQTSQGCVRLTAGTYLVGSSIAITGPLVFLPGASLVIPTGVTVTASGGIQAPLQKIFTCSGTGKVALSNQPTGYPEWWGAVPGGADCLAAINACIIAVPETKLQAADYYVSGTVLLQTESRVLRGSGWSYDGVAGLASRILVMSGSLNVLQVGPTAQPGSINLFQKGNVVENIELTRTIVPVVASACSGLIATFCSYLIVRQVKSTESMYSFHYAGLVSSHSLNCYAFRSTVGSGGGDFWYGFYIDGSSYNIGASGGNASLYFDGCNAGIGAGPASTSNGFYLSSPFTDCYLSRCETSGTNVGINVQGNSSVVQNYGNIDLMITNPVIDSFLLAGILLQNISEFGAVEINGGYAAPAAGATQVACIYLNASVGAVSISNFQGICTPNALCHGITAINSASISTNGCIWVDSTAGAIALSTCRSCTFNDMITSYSASSAFALQMASCTRCKINPVVTGAANKFSIGVQMLAAANHFNEINCTGIDSAAVNGGSGNKLLSNGAQVVAVGTFNTDNLASGVMT